MNVGQVVVKLNGRFAGRLGVVIDDKELDKGYITIVIPYAEGKTKIKRTNINHVLPIGKSLKLGDNKEGKALWDVIAKSGMHDMFIKKIKV